MNIAVKRAYEPPETSDGCRVLVDRVWPRGLTKETLHLNAWVKDISPSTPLRKWFNHEPAKWEEFRKKYMEELSGNAPALLAFAEATKGCEKITLIYGAKNQEQNQAIVLREFLQKKPGA